MSVDVFTVFLPILSILCSSASYTVQKPDVKSQTEVLFESMTRQRAVKLGIKFYYRPSYPTQSRRYSCALFPAFDVFFLY